MTPKLFNKVHKKKFKLLKFLNKKFKLNLTEYHLVNNQYLQTKYKKIGL